MLREAHDVNEYAFALGALAHYTADNIGHPEGGQPCGGVDVSEAAREVRRLGDLRATSPATHVMVEFSFDVVQAASGAYVLGHVSELHRLPGRQAGARAGVPGDLRPRDEGRVPDRGSGDRLLPPRRQRDDPEITRIAWRDKREEIQKLNPGAAQEKFVFNLSRQEYDKAYGARVPASPACSRGSWRFSTSCCRRSDRCGRLSSRRRRKEAEALFLRELQATRASAIARALDAIRVAASRSAEHQFRHRQAQRPRRIFAGRRHLRRTARSPDARTAARRSRRRCAPNINALLRARQAAAEKKERKRRDRSRNGSRC